MSQLADRYSYPPAKVGDIVDDYHGTPVADPYRWLEDDHDAETVAWVTAQNQLTRALLDAVPARAPIKARLTQLWDYPRVGVPFKRAGSYFFLRNDGLQNQSALYRQPTLDAAPELIFDPNLLSADGTAALTSLSISWDGRLLAYGISRDGSDWQQLAVRDLASGADHPETLEWCRYTSIAWLPDNSGFFYSRFPEPGSLPGAGPTQHNRVYLHWVGQPQSTDQLVFERPDAPDLSFDPWITDDGRFLILRVWEGTAPENRIYYRPVASDGPFLRLLDDADARYDVIDIIGTTVYLVTDLAAPRGRVIAIDLDRPDRADWREIIPQQDDVIAFATATAGRLALVMIHHVCHRLWLYRLDGQCEGELALPALGSITGLDGRLDEPELLLNFVSFLVPPQTLRYDATSGVLAPFHQAAPVADLSAYEARQVFCRSRDGTQVPMFVLARKDLVLDGSHPTLLYGYGGFNIALTPFFSPGPLVWLALGGVYVVANLRGGSEYGESWHQAGMFERKQNVFDDFIAAAEWLIDKGYTSAARLAIQGGSNGGLLVAACMVQRPELFSAVVCQVPVLDMLRYQRFTVGRYWVVEYGDADASPAHFQFLRAYSPLHNLRPGQRYPATLILTADTDDRVVPAHARKFAAALQAADTGDNPLLLRVERNAGHGVGKPTGKLIDEASDIYSFLAARFGLSLS